MPEHASHAIARYLAMVTWIGRQPHRRTTVGELAEHFGRNLRQIENDLRQLTLFRDSLPGESFELSWFEPEKGTSSAQKLATPISVRSTRGLDLPPAFSDEEVATIIVGLRAVAPLLSEEDQQAIPPTVMALEAMSTSQSHLHESIVDMPRSQAHEALQILRQAITAQRMVTFRYTAHNQVRSERRVEPLALEQGPSGWQLHAWCHSADALRLFIVERMEDLEVTDDHFAPSARPLHREEEATVEVTLAKDAQWVAEAYASRVLAQTYNSVTIELPVWDRRWVRDLLIRVASSILSVSDETFTEEMGAHARRVLSVWEQLGGIQKEAECSADGTLDS